MSVGKGLSSGYTPIAVEEVYDAIYKESTSFVHGHTYGGNPLSCAVALAVQNYIETQDLVSQCARIGELMLDRLMPLQELPIAGEVRGKGLLIGTEFVADREKKAPVDPLQGVTGMIVDSIFEKGVLVMPGAPGLIDGVAGVHIAIIRLLQLRKQKPIKRWKLSGKASLKSQRDWVTNQITESNDARQIQDSKKP